ncbi:carbohydrate ABC transporter permease [Fredinandcohnia sp. 179-A 10B2 NHS]|uniref:carbohydrate ABC transporter permease n=1 Tax=Fredinandcohnia sp. 179-A 10B2 NHS TaxID=3235176 RepID=UPI0039A272B3
MDLSVREEKRSFVETIKKNSFLIFTLIPGFLYILAFFLIIVFFIIQMSLTTYVGGMAEASPTIQNFVDLTSSEEFKDAFSRTFMFVIISTPLQLITGLVTAMIVNKSFKGRGIVRSIFLLPLAIPTIVTTSTLLLLFSKGGHITSLLMGDYSWFPAIVDHEISFLSNETLAMGLSILGKVWRDTPISMLILLAGLQSIDESQYEAAKTMGANSVRQFMYITVPLLIPAISSVLVLRSIEAWKEFIFPYILAPSYPILGVLIEKYFVQLNNPGMAAAIGIILIILIVIFTLFLNWLLKKVNDLLVRV